MIVDQAAAGERRRPDIVARQIEDDAADAVAAGRRADAPFRFLRRRRIPGWHRSACRAARRKPPASSSRPARGHRRCRRRLRPAPGRPRDRRSPARYRSWCATRHGRRPRCPARSGCRRRHRAPAAPSSSSCTWQISSAPDDLMRGANGLGSPNESMIARGRASSAMSSSAGCLARLQVMKPMPKGSDTSASLAVSCFEPRLVTVAAAKNAEPAGGADGRGETRARDDVHRRRQDRMLDAQTSGQWRGDRHVRSLQSGQQV